MPVNEPTPPHRPPGDGAFYASFAILGGVYVLLIAALVAAEIGFTRPASVIAALQSPEIRYATWLSLASASLSTILALWVAVPLGYLMSRHAFRGCWLVEALIDVPVVLPPLVVGLSLLLLFQSSAGAW